MASENKAEYCSGCRHNGDHKNSNGPIKCPVGHKASQPKSELATINALKNGTHVCSRNSWKFLV